MVVRKREILKKIEWCRSTDAVKKGNIVLTGMENNTTMSKGGCRPRLQSNLRLFLLLWAVAGIGYVLVLERVFMFAVALPEASVVTDDTETPVPEERQPGFGRCFGGYTDAKGTTDILEERSHRPLFPAFSVDDVQQKRATTRGSSLVDRRCRVEGSTTKKLRHNPLCAAEVL